MSSNIIQQLLSHQAIKVSINPPFVWTSGIKSPIYCDNRILISSPLARKEIITGFKQLIRDHNLEFTVIGGTATAAIPWASFLAYELNKPMVYIRPKPKGHGAGRQVEGNMPIGSKVLIVEDLISTAGSAITSAEACKREFKADIVGIMAIFSYNFPIAQENLTQHNFLHWTLANFNELVNELPIEKPEKDMVLDFAKNPSSWGEKWGLV